MIKKTKYGADVCNKFFKMKFLEVTISQNTKKGKFSMVYHPVDAQEELSQSEDKKLSENGRIVEIQISHNIFHQEIIGRLAFVDTYNYLQEHLDFEKCREYGTEIVLNIKVIDSFSDTLSIDDCTYEQEFVVLNFLKHELKSSKSADEKYLFDFNFIDRPSYELLKGYQAGTLKTKELDQNTTTNLVKSVYSGLGVKTVVHETSPDDIPHTIVLKTGVNLLCSLDHEERTSNVFCTRRHKELVIGNMSKKVFQTLTPDILEYSDYFDEDKIFNNPQFAFETFVPLDRAEKPKKSWQIRDVNLQIQDGSSTYNKLIRIQDVVTPILLNNNSEEIPSAGDIKQIPSNTMVASPSHVKNIITRLLMTRNTYCIIVPTSFKYGDVGNIIYFKKSNFSSKNYEKRVRGDPKLSGYWVIGEAIHMLLLTDGLANCNLDVDIPVTALILYRCDNPKTADLE